MNTKNFLTLPIQASTHASKIDFIIILVHYLMFILAIGWGIYLTYTIFHFRASQHKKADYRGIQNHISTYIEVGVVVSEVILLIGLSIPFWSNIVTNFPDSSEALTVRVVAQQYAWNIHYAGPDGIFGRSHSQFVNAQTNAIGLDLNDKNGIDDIVTVNQLIIPINKPVIIQLSSLDVIHCFGIPAMRVKQDILPGMSTPTWFEANKLGTYEIMCAQLCGIGHYRMRGFVQVKTKKDFDTWMQKKIKESVVDENQDNFWL